MEKRTDSADTSVLVFRLSVIIFASRRMQAPFFCILHFMLFHTMLIGTCNIISIECDDIGRISIRTWRTFKYRQTDYNGLKHKCIGPALQKRNLYFRKVVNIIYDIFPLFFFCNFVSFIFFRNSVLYTFFQDSFMFLDFNLFLISWLVFQSC